MSFRAFCRALALPLAFVMLLLTGPLAAVQAAMVSTDTVLSQTAAEADRARVLDFLAREDVRRQMRALGVSPEEAEARTRALSDQEIARIAGRLDEAEAGQGTIGTIVGAGVLIFLVLLLTDLLCLTTVFNFTKCATRD